MNEMEELRRLFECGGVWRRKELTEAMGMEDRRVRILIRQLRISGVPIKACPGGGYKLATEQEEIDEIVADYMHRAREEIYAAIAIQRGGVSK